MRKTQNGLLNAKLVGRVFSLICYCVTDCENLDLCVCTFVTRLAIFCSFGWMRMMKPCLQNPLAIKKLKASVIYNLMEDNKNELIPEKLFLHFFNFEELTVYLIYTMIILSLLFL